MAAKHRFAHYKVNYSRCCQCKPKRLFNKGAASFVHCELAYRCYQRFNFTPSPSFGTLRNGLREVDSRLPDEVAMRFKHQSVATVGRRLAVCAVASLALLGCSKKDEGTSATSTSQVVARVGDQVVSAQELDTELRWNNVAADRRRDDVVVKRVLGELVTRKYLLQQALNAKLDREPTVLLDILRSREQVLSKAFAMREVSRQVSAITTVDTEKYIIDHPHKFANRKILAIEQISFPLGSSDQSLVDSLKDLSALVKVEQRLTELGIVHARSSATISTSEIPDELFRSIQERKGDLTFVRSGQNGLFLSVKGEEARPLQGEAAIALARQLQQQEIARAQASLTSFSANMETKYEGEYARIMGEHLELPNITN
jgi:EpsD family peptidyl-prolyl cis-trans isomerase